MLLLLMRARRSRSAKCSRIHRRRSCARLAPSPPLHRPPRDPQRRRLHARTQQPASGKAHWSVGAQLSGTLQREERQQACSALTRHRQARCGRRRGPNRSVGRSRPRTQRTCNTTERMSRNARQPNGRRRNPSKAAPAKAGGDDGHQRLARPRVGDEDDDDTNSQRGCAHQGPEHEESLGGGTRHFSERDKQTGCCLLANCTTADLQQLTSDKDKQT